MPTTQGQSLLDSTTPYYLCPVTLSKLDWNPQLIHFLLNFNNLQNSRAVTQTQNSHISRRKKCGLNIERIRFSISKIFGNFLFILQIYSYICFPEYELLCHYVWCGKVCDWLRERKCCSFLYCFSSFFYVYRAPGLFIRQ